MAALSSNVLALPAPRSPSPTISTLRGPAPSSRCPIPRSRPWHRTCACIMSWCAIRKAACCPRRSPTTSTITAARNTTSWCSAYDFAAGEKRATFTLESVAEATPPEAPCVYARTVPERYDDMAWENDRIAHRMYGARAQLARGRRRAAARQRHRRVGEARAVSDHRSLVREGPRSVPQG